MSHFSHITGHALAPLVSRTLYCYPISKMTAPIMISPGTIPVSHVLCEIENANVMCFKGNKNAIVICFMGNNKKWNCYMCMGNDMNVVLGHDSAL